MLKMYGSILENHSFLSLSNLIKASEIKFYGKSEEGAIPIRRINRLNSDKN